MVIERNTYVDSFGDERMKIHVYRKEPVYRDTYSGAREDEDT